jgi:hypothetical protein
MTTAPLAIRAISVMITSTRVWSTRYSTVNHSTRPTAVFPCDDGDDGDGVALVLSLVICVDDDSSRLTLFCLRAHQLFVHDLCCCYEPFWFIEFIESISPIHALNRACVLPTRVIDEDQGLRSAQISRAYGVFSSIEVDMRVAYVSGRPLSLVSRVHRSNGDAFCTIRWQRRWSAQNSRATL